MRVTAFRCTSDHTTAKSALSIGNLAIQQIVPSWSCRLCRHLTTYCAARSQAEAIKAIGSQQPGLVRADVFLSCGTSHKSPHTRQKYCSTSASVQMQFQKLTGSKCASGPEPILFAAPSDPDRTSSFPGPTVAWFLAGKIARLVQMPAIDTTTRTHAVKIVKGSAPQGAGEKPRRCLRHSLHSPQAVNCDCDCLYLLRKSQVEFPTGTQSENKG